MSFGNRVGFAADPAASAPWYAPCPGSIVAELTEDAAFGVRIGATTAQPVITLCGETVSIDQLSADNEGVLEEVYPTDPGQKAEPVEPITYDRRSPAVFSGQIARPRAVIPVFPGTNCEYDTAAACLRAGIQPEILVVRNVDPQALHESADALAAAIGNSQIVVLPGGFSGGDEPDGSAKFIVSFFRNPKLTDAVHGLLKDRDGLMLGICNGFQALVKLGLVPFGEIRPTDDQCPTLTFNLIGRHQSRYVTTRVASVRSPWMLNSHVDDRHTIAISHGEGRFVAPQGVVDQLIANGQVATQYVDPVTGQPHMGIECNPNGSVACIEGIFSPDGRVFGKMGHTEREGRWVAKNIPGEKHQPIFESGALYFR
jgi:phosphoribosylformylglycinamidine synthase